MTRVRRAGLTLVVALVLTAASACSLVARIGGPKWSERAEPIAEGYGFADHRDEERLRFLVFGDAGTGKEDQKEVARLMARECASRGGCDFALMTGDNIYMAGVRPSRGSGDPRFAERFEVPYEPLGRLDMWAVPGNHDWFTRGSVDTQVRYTRASPRWRMPSHDYAVPGLPEWIRIYGLDTVKLSRGRDPQQIERARRSLCDAPGWKLLFGHHPLYSSGKHANRAGEHPEMEASALAPLVDACGVQVYFAGHDHHQEYLAAPGFEQIVQGAAGKLRRVRRVEKRSPEVESLYAASRFGFALVEATADRLVVRFFGYGRETAYDRLFCRAVELGGGTHACAEGE